MQTPRNAKMKRVFVSRKISFTDTRLYAAVQKRKDLKPTLSVECKTCHQGFFFY